MTTKGFGHPSNLLYNSQYLHGRSPSSSLSFNLPLRMTMGLCTLYNDIQQNKIVGKRKDKRDDSRTIQDGSVKNFDHIPLLACRYQFIRDIARGTYSQVILAQDVYSPAKRSVAIKVTNAHYRYIGVQETCRLRTLNRKDRDGSAHIIRLLSTFTLYNAHFCLVLELLQASLLSLSSIHYPPPIATDNLKVVVVQILGSLSFLSGQHIIHADLKPENVLIGSRDQPFNGAPKPPPRAGKVLVGTEEFTLKIADFGNAMEIGDASAYYDDFEVQSLYYRAPEVVLGLPFGPAIDMWSLGCILVELYLGRPLFKAEGRPQLLARMIATLGPIPREVFERGKYYSMYFSSDHRPVHPELCRSQCPAPLAPGVTSPVNAHMGLACLLQAQDPLLVDFLAKLLQYDPRHRMTPQQAFSHPFVQAQLAAMSLLPVDSVVPSRPPAVAAVTTARVPYIPLAMATGVATLQAPKRTIPADQWNPMRQPPFVTVADSASRLVNSRFMEPTRPSSSWQTVQADSVEGHKRKRAVDVSEMRGIGPVASSSGTGHTTPDGRFRYDLSRRAPEMEYRQAAEWTAGGMKSGARTRMNDSSPQSVDFREKTRKRNNGTHTGSISIDDARTWYSSTGDRQLETPYTAPRYDDRNAVAYPPPQPYLGVRCGEPWMPFELPQLRAAAAVGGVFPNNRDPRMRIWELSSN